MWGRGLDVYGAKTRVLNDALRREAQPPRHSVDVFADT